MKIKNILFLLAAFLLFGVSVMAAEDPFLNASDLVKNGKYEEAIKLLIHIKQLYPDSEWYPKCILMTARIYEKMKKYNDALAEYKSLIEKFPQNSLTEEAYFSVGGIRSFLNQQDSAVKAYDAYLKNYPAGRYCVIALFNTASIYRDSGQEDEAMKYYGKILSFYPDDKWFYSWAAIYTGDIFSKRKDYDRAIEAYERVIKSPDNSTLYGLSLLHRAQAMMDKNDFISAKAAFKEILKMNNGFQEEALYGMGKAHYKLGEYDMAKEIYISLLDLFPDTVWRKNVEKGLKIIGQKLDKQRAEAGDDL
jgi:tetratricopeptide (TPR) repeat protein